MDPGRFDTLTKSLASARSWQQVLTTIVRTATGRLRGRPADICTMTTTDSQRITTFSTSVRDLTVVGQGRMHQQGLHDHFVLTVSRDGTVVIHFEASLTASGTYRATWRYGDMVTGVRGAGFTTNDGSHIEGTVNGRPVTPFTAGTASPLTFADGMPVPSVHFPRHILQALREIPSALQRTLATCHDTDSHELDIRSNNDRFAFGFPPRFDDTEQTDNCKTCIAEAYAAAAACGLSFGIACACIAGIPLLFVRCHAPGQGCCPVACGALQTTLGIDITFQCCFGGDTLPQPLNRGLLWPGAAAV